MIGEVDIFGVLVPPLLVWLALALPLTAGLRWLLGRLGVYAYVWHRALFDLALLVIVLGGVSAAANHFL